MLSVEVTVTDYGFDDLAPDRAAPAHSMKWRAYRRTCCLVWVAEMDFETPPRLSRGSAGASPAAVTSGTPSTWSSGLHEAFSGFAARRWGWALDPTGWCCCATSWRGIELWIEGFTRPVTAW